MINIQLDNEKASYRPGDPISGMVQWSEEDGDALEARLIWYTSGKGDRDFELVAVQHVSNFDSSGKEKFQFAAPHRPQSFAGKLISLQWAIEAIVFPSHNAERSELTISNNGNGIYLYSSPLD